MRKKILAEKSVEQGLNQFQFIEQMIFVCKWVLGSPKKWKM